MKKVLHVYRGSIAAPRANSRHFRFTPYAGHIVASHQQLTRSVKLGPPAMFAARPLCI
jgi:hypothetical protein